MLSRSLARVALATTLLLTGFLGGCATLVAGSEQTPQAPTPTAVSRLAPGQATTELSVMAVPALPPEAVETLVLIDEGGPYPYRQDGATFQNREGLLPSEPSGYYTEYTVETPGSADRGARHIIAAESGARFYTQDHYRSFREIIQ